MTGTPDGEVTSYRKKPRVLLTSAPVAPATHRPTIGVGREQGRRYCDACGHTKARCVCDS